MKECTHQFPALAGRMPMTLLELDPSTTLHFCVGTKRSL